MTQHHHPGIHLGHHGHQVVTVRMGGEVEIQHLAVAVQLAHRRAEEETLARLGGLEPASRRLRIGIPDEEDAVPLITDDARGQGMGTGVLAHHAGGHHENPAATQRHRLDIVGGDDLEIQGMGQLEVGVVSVRPVGLEVVDLGEDPAEASDVHRLLAQLPGTHQQGQQGEDLLGATQGEGGDQDRALPGQNPVDPVGQSLQLVIAVEVRGQLTRTAGGFHDQHVGTYALEIGGPEQRLVVEAHVAGVEERLLSTPHQDPGRTQGVTGIEELQRGDMTTTRRRAVPSGELGPLDLASIAEALEHRGVIIDLLMGVQRVLADPQLVALAHHDVDRVVQHPLDDEVAQVGHQDPGMGKILERHGQRPDMIVMAMGQGDGVDLQILDRLVERERGESFAFGVGPGVHQELMAIHRQHPGTGSDVVVRVEIRDPHRGHG